MQIMQSANVITSLLAFGFSVTLSLAQPSFDWLEGQWKQKGKSAYEVWKKGKNENLWEGVAFKILPTGDTLVTEEIKIIRQSSSYAYVPDVAGNQGPVRFLITGHSEAGFVAENPAHDFPTKIEYVFFKSENRMQATISGNGKSIDFHFEKVTSAKN